MDMTIYFVFQDGRRRRWRERKHSYTSEATGEDMDGIFFYLRGAFVFKRRKKSASVVVQQIKVTKKDDQQVPYFRKTSNVAKMK